MTVIRPNSISGVTSITALANEINVFKHDGVLAGLQLNGVNHHTSSGVSTFHTLNVLGNVSVGGTLTYQDVTNVDSLGIGTFRTGINVSGGQLDVGSNIKLGNAGVITATSFVGSGANLTGITAGLSNIVEDTSPQLGGNLDNNGKNITFGDSAGSSDDRLTFGAGTDLSIYHDNSNSRSRIEHSTDNALEILQGGNAGMLIQNQNSYNIEIKTNAEDAIKCVANGAVELYYNNNKKAETTNGGIQVTGSVACSGGSSNNLSLPDDGKVKVGTGDDLQIYHDGLNTYMKNFTNNLHIGAFSVGSNSGMAFYSNNTIQMYLNPDGHLVPDANNNHDLGTTSLRWRNIYTNDLNLSNEGGKNNVDGTWGNYTIQEGESDLFLINNRSGKRYKFNLTEVS